MKVAWIFDVQSEKAISALRAALEVGDHAWVKELIDDFGQGTEFFEYVD